MGRLPRPNADAEGSLCFHAFNRGNNRDDVFTDGDDRLAFLGALAKAKERYPFALYGYCLMTNHVHLVLKPGPDQSISRIMQSITVTHTWRHHRRHRSVGHVWQGRFKSPAIQSGDYFLSVLAYVEANPLRARMVSDPIEYRWSSHRGRMGVRPDPLLDDFPEWTELAGNDRWRRVAWSKRVRALLDAPRLSAVRSSVVSGRPLGDTNWVEQTTKELGLPIPRPRGRPKKSEN